MTNQPTFYNDGDNEGLEPADNLGLNANPNYHPENQGQQ